MQDGMTVSFLMGWLEVGSITSPNLFCRPLLEGYFSPPDSYVKVFEEA